MTDADYLPKHLKTYERALDHCCFAGCTPMGCEGGCCQFGFGHRADCPSSISRQWDDAEHDIYVSQGMRKHLRSETTTFLSSRGSYLCPSCGGPARIVKRICFGADPHNVFACRCCDWSGRRPNFGAYLDG